MKWNDWWYILGMILPMVGFGLVLFTAGPILRFVRIYNPFISMFPIIALTWILGIIFMVMIKIVWGGIPH